MATPASTDSLTFDYIIVGAGSAGCALASRLTEDPDVTVALLEAGPHDHHFSVWVPAGCAASLPFKNQRNYAYETVPQPGLGGRQGYQPRGRGLGGSSSLNAMIYIRGTHHDYDHWASLGCTGWNWDNVLPYFKRAECNERLAGRDDDPLHGGTGPLHVSDLRTGNLRVGATGPYYILPSVAAFRSRHPTVEITIELGNSQQMLEALSEVRLDLAVSSHAVDDDRLSRVTLAEDRMVLVVPLDHPLARCPHAALADVAGCHLLTREHGSMTRRVTEDALRAAGCERIFEETASGAKADRPVLKEGIAYARPGDVLVVWRLDRLGRCAYRQSEYGNCGNFSK